MEKISVFLVLCCGLVGSQDCDFEGNSWCSWLNDQNDTFDWELRQGSTAHPHTGPSVDHTYGNISGYYIYIDNVGARTEGDPARIISPDVSFATNQSKCLTFWYHMYGAHIGSLNVYLKSNSTLGDIIWSRKTTHGDQWNEARVSLKSSSSSTSKIVLEAQQGYRIHGDIAVDDITLVDGYCTLAYTGCDFERETMCNGTNDETNDFDWSISTGDDDTGPFFDHTYESGTGHYLLAEGTSTNGPQTARFLTDTLNLDSNKCLQFFYAWQGLDVGVLSVRIKIDNSLGQPIWERQLQIGDGWNIGRASLRQQANFQVVFEFVRGTNETGYVVIDDIEVMDVNCTNPSHCDFEHGKCTWSNIVNGDDLDWVLLSGPTSSGGTGPTNDHTIGNDDGVYLYLEGSNANAGTTAKLYSQTFPSNTTNGCLEFWYNMNGGGIGTLRVDIVKGDDPTTPDTIWTLSGNQGTEWEYGRVPFSQTTEYQLIFVAIRGNGPSSDIAIDDVVISDGYCTGVPETTTVYPTTVDMPSTAPPTTSPPFPPSPTPQPSCSPNEFNCNADSRCISNDRVCNFRSDCTDGEDEVGCVSKYCDFEGNSWYGWTNDQSDIFDWELRQGSTFHPHTGPSVDHTYGNNSGYYIYIDNDVARTEGDPARIVSPDISLATNQSKCLTFWYHMYGAHIGSLNVYLKSNATLGDVIWSRKTTYGDQWNEARVSLKSSSSSTSKIVLEAQQGYKIHGDIAVDDITLADGYCTLAYTGCDFERGIMCNGTNDGTNDFDWSISTGDDGIGPSMDHTLESGTGHYLLAEGTSTNGSETARFLTDILNIESNRCLQFFYAWQGLDVGVLSVRIKIDNSFGQPIWERQLQIGDGWNIGRASLTQQANFQVVFEFVRGTNETGYVVIDDIQVMDVDCPNSSHCDFEDGKCSWSNIVSGDDLDWVLVSGSTSTDDTGPTNDHTTGNDDGVYLYLEGSNAHTGATAKLYSQTFPANSTPGCIEFWYNMNGGGIGTLRVDIITGDDPTTPNTIWTLSGNQGSEWEYGRVSFSQTTEYQLIFVATRGSGASSDIAIDDVVISDGYCTGVPGTTTVDPTTVDMPSTAPPTTPPPSSLPPTPKPSCSPNEFYCNADSRCISADRVCDFRSDCTDGDDEVRCAKSCDFESGMCGWLGVSDESRKRRAEPVPQFIWERKQGKTKLPSEHRPATDHTEESGEGYYAFADNSPGLNLDKAELYSPTIGNTGPNCHLQFYYNMGSMNHYGSLQLRKRSANYTEISFSHTGPMDKWQKARVYIGTGQSYQIFFVALRGNYHYGVESIDDVKFIDCEPPVMTSDPCLSSEYTCGNNICIDKSKVCNFVDDCLDNTDEDNCETLAGRCDFEISTCDWKQEGDDNFDWDLITGSAGTGPSTDHTTRSDKGRYLFIETSYPYYIARIASPTFLATSSNCTLYLRRLDPRRSQPVYTDTIVKGTEELEEQRDIIMSTTGSLFPLLARVVCLFLFSREADVDASSPFKECPSDTVTVVGREVQLNCSFNSLESTPQWQFRRIPTMRFTEIIVGSTIHDINYQLKEDMSKGEYHLLIPNVKLDLSGTYECSLVTTEHYRWAELTVLDFPKCRVSPSSTVVSDKEVVTFTCHINGNLMGDLVWLRNGKEISRRTAATNEYRTTLKKVDNGARYNCRYENQSVPSHSWPNPSCSEDIIMDVQYGPDVKINGTDKDEITVLEGQSVSLECVIDANPQAESHEWIIRLKDETVVSSSLTYYIQRVDCKDVGIYECIASNKFHDGTITTGNASLSLSVQGPTVCRAPIFKVALGFHFIIALVTAIVVDSA